MLAQGRAYSMVVKYTKGSRVLFCFVLMYKGNKKTNFKALAPNPDFQPIGPSFPVNVTEI